MRNILPHLCLFLSGFAGLVYEVCWIRQGTLVFGSTTLSTSTVLAVFFAGLALGSFLFGRVSARVGRPLRWYAAVELAVAALGLATLALFPLADDLYGRVYRALGEGAAGLDVVRLVLVAAILLPAATGMGATLPLMCAAYASWRGRPADPVAVFYGINTLGAAVGAAAAGLLLVPTVGVTRAVVLAAFANLLAAALASRIRRPDPDRSRPVEVRRAARSPASRTGVAALFFFSGFIALAHEVLWTRYLGLLVRNTVYTFTLSLTAVLAGIVVGSLLAARLSRRGPSSGWAFGALQILIGLYVLTLMLLPSRTWERLGSGIAVYFLLFLPPAALSGASFPLAVRLVADDSSALGYQVGRMAALNIVGGIAGSLFAGFAALPHWGLQASTLFTTGLSLAVGIAAWFLPGRNAVRERPAGTGAPEAAARRGGSRVLAGALAIAALSLWIAVPRWLGTHIPQDFLGGDGPIVDFREGMLSNVAVIRAGDALQMQIDRWWQGQDTKTHQIMAAHVPMLLHTAPRSVLVVGVGTGQTASRFLFYPIERLDVVDIEPAVFDLIRPHFRHDWLDDRRVHLIREDGRNYVAHTDRRYDVISLEVGQVFRPGVASFYTHEFYARARARLASGGLLCQFVPLPFLTVEQFRNIVGTFLEDFPEATLWYNTSELLLIGRSGTPLSLTPGRLALLSNDVAVYEDLRYSHWAGPARWLNQPREFLATFLSGGPGLRALARGALRYHDDRPVLEYATRDVDEREARDALIADTLRAYLDPPELILAGTIPPDSAAAIAAARERNLADVTASARVRQAGLLDSQRRFAEMEVLLNEALRLNPESLAGQRMLAGVLLQMNRLPDARTHYDAALRIDPWDQVSLRGLGTWYLVGGRYEEARSLFRTALSVHPADPDAHNNLGVALGNLGDATGAVDHFKEAVRLRPGFADAQNNLRQAEEALRKRVGRP